jgi:hypothetical protein
MPVASVRTTRMTSPDTRHTSHVTRHTLHVTSHLPLWTNAGGCVPSTNTSTAH